MGSLKEDYGSRELPRQRHEVGYHPNGGYDAHGRQNTVMDLRGGTTTLVYNNADLVVSATTPPAGDGTGQLTTLTRYDRMLRATNVVSGDGGSVTNEYYANGLLKKTSGARTYPVEYTYDAQGRMSTMRTWRSVSEDQSAFTTWSYHASRGWLEFKDYPWEVDGSPVYPDSTGVSYTYTPGGRLASRIWRRGENLDRVTTLYYYGFNMGVGQYYGELAQVSYLNDPSGTPVANYYYDRRGLQVAVVRGGSTTRMAYNTAGQLTAEVYEGGVLGGLSVVKTVDSTLRPVSVQARQGAQVLAGEGYGYDLAGRLARATNGAAWVQYPYLANSALVEQINYYSGSTLRMRQARSYDLLNRLRQTGATAYTNGAGYEASGGAYAYNAAHQRVRTDNSAEGTYWLYTYDRLGQVTSGKKYWADGTPVAGQQFEYAFDDIGNRTGNKAGGDERGQGLRDSTYTANFLNQYTQRTVSDKVDLFGVARGTVLVEGSTNGVYRKGEYFRKEVTRDNSAGPVWASATLTATNGPATSNQVRNAFVAQTPEVFSYDWDGNLLSDGRWEYTWDAENRLTRVNTGMFHPGPAYSIEFAYDWMGRRVRKQVYDAVVAGNLVLDEKYLYEGWNLLAVLNATNNAVVRSFLWGSDLSGSMQGAGGVGGLLAVCDPARGTHFAHADANGNVTLLVSASDGTVSARYDYGPFGEPLRASGPMALANPFRFSTKFQDEETGLLYYGFRYYNPSTGRWISRDPIEERGGKNLYSAGENDPIDSVDALGLECFSGNARTFGLGTSGSIFGNLKWKFEVKGQKRKKKCDKCCSDGRRVIDEEDEWGAIVIRSLSGSTSGGSMEFGTVKASFWYGVRGELSGSGEGSGVFKTDRCNNREMEGKFCVTGIIAGSLAVGGEITFQWGWTRWTTGLSGAASGSVSATRCYSCLNGNCEWSKWKICQKGSIDLNIGFGYGSVTANLLSGSDCFELE